MSLTSLLLWGSDLLHQAGCLTAKLDAQVLLAHSLNIDRVSLLLDKQQLTDQDSKKYKKFIERRCQGEPIAYLIGRCEFWSLDFDVTPDVLIPRPETEIMVEKGLNLIKTIDHPHVADVGTGCGVMAIVMKKERNDVSMVATDNSCRALDVVKRNAIKHRTSIDIRHGDLCEAFKQEEQFDLIVANLPYISSDEIADLDLDFEPRSALDGGKNGLDIINIFLNSVFRYMKPHAPLLLEHGFDQNDQITAIFSQTNQFLPAQTLSDYSDFPRITYACKK